MAVDEILNHVARRKSRTCSPRRADHVVEFRRKAGSVSGRITIKQKRNSGLRRVSGTGLKNPPGAANPRATLEAAGDCREMSSPPHPRLRNRHSLPRAMSNGAPPSDYAARELWTAIPCDSLECRRVIPTSESPTIRTRASCNDCDEASKLVVESSMKHERMIWVSKR
jgi:hypothetical protein